MPGRSSAYLSKDDAIPPGRLPDSIATQALDCAPGGHLVDPTAWIEPPKD